MMLYAIVIRLAVLALLLCSCSMSPSADVITALGKDPANVCLRVTSVYGTVTYARANAAGVDVNCDIFTTRTPTTAVGIPLTIMPTFRIQQP